MFIQIWN